MPGGNRKRVGGVMTPPYSPALKSLRRRRKWLLLEEKALVLSVGAKKLPLRVQRELPELQVQLRAEQGFCLSEHP